MKFCFFLVMFLSVYTINAQTYFYKRIKIINKTHIENVNDDAHYITFTKDRCYDSDENGISNNSLGLEFIKSNNNILCYYGYCFWGSDCYYYVSASKDRININNNGIIYVYEKIDSQSNTAKLRQENVQTDIYVQSPQQVFIDNTETFKSIYKKTCPACNGSGKSIDQIIYTPNYTGRSNDIYCKICNKVMPDHTHHQPMCRACYGKGYIEY